MKRLSSLFSKNLFLMSTFGVLVCGATAYKERLAHKKATAFYDEDTFIEPSTQFKSKHINMIVTQAYRDMGFHGPVYIKFNTEADSTETFSAFDHDFKNAAFVKLDRKLLKDIPDGQIYAVAGHEAVHTIHHHQRLAGFIQIISLLSPIFFTTKMMSLLALYTLYFFANLRFERFLEKDADITSAKTLGTGPCLISYFESTIRNSKKPSNQPENVPIEIGFNSHTITFYAKRAIVDTLVDEVIVRDPHPPTATRIEYLKCLQNSTGSSPLLFKSQTWRTILSEREKQANNNKEVTGRTGML